MRIRARGHFPMAPRREDDGRAPDLTAPPRPGEFANQQVQRACMNRSVWVYCGPQVPPAQVSSRFEFRGQVQMDKGS